MSPRKSIRLLGVVGALAALAAASPAFGDGALAIEDLEGAASVIGYGALAIDESDCSRAGVAIGYESSVEADSVALDECGEGCSVVERFTGGLRRFRVRRKRRERVVRLGDWGGQRVRGCGCSTAGMPRRRRDRLRYAPIGLRRC